MLLDNNIIIYGSQPEHSFLRTLLEAVDSVVSGVSYPEVLGYPGLSQADKSDFEAFFSTTPILPVAGDSGQNSHACRLNCTDACLPWLRPRSCHSLDHFASRSSP